ncbi:uncharacterized protein DSM5745_05426 [Aspergillus mulundensis]|uniref:Lincomycin-condensing protein lmbA n=1 Tax=Aspergillus mulundensis TaxID=1810919 RepID=A0A3D8RXK3_9EURO|nr:hypothetical protein DSM5745_05426 [Aspergillus mulundensis]RDW78574.1 hypothetical protein DSM5745_05426 [Aspergillus mulundensis]
MSLLQPILDCIFGASPSTTTITNNTTASRSPESIASDIVTKILSADSPYTLHKELQDEVSTTGWTEAVAKATLQGLDNAIKAGAKMAKAAADALGQAKDAALEFSTEHPYYTTLIALGVLAVLMPWMLEVLGFGELGPIEGSFAAWWQRKYAGEIPKRALFTYFQRLGMKWHWL